MRDPEINAVSGSPSVNGPLSGAATVTAQIILSAPSPLPAPHTDTTHTTERVSARAGLSVCLCKGHSYKVLEEFGYQPETVAVGGGCKRKTDS